LNSYPAGGVFLTLTAQAPAKELGADLDNWRTSIMDYLSNPSAKDGKSIWQLASNYFWSMVICIDFLPNACC
jgi:hypothetical protein